MSKKYNQIEVKDNMKIEETSKEVEAPVEKKEIKPVVSAQPTKVKRGLFNRLISGVAGPEGVAGIGSYVNNEIIMPAIKNIIVDAVTSGINMIMYGEKGGPNRGYRPPYSGHGGHRSHVNYSANYKSNSVDPVQQERVVRPNSRNSIPDYKIIDRHEAAEVLIALTESADMYGHVSVADYYDYIGVPSQYTDNNYGWTHDAIMNATIVPVRGGGGYVIKFPPVEVI